MQLTNFVTYLSLFVGIASLGISVFTIWYAKQSEREARANFDRTRDLLGEIDKRSALIEHTVTEAQNTLLATLTRIIDETVIPKKLNLSEQMSAGFLQMMMSDPQNAMNMITTLLPLINQQDKNHQPE